jgi:oligoribonuclease (3'-5' exoribonuclease)
MKAAPKSRMPLSREEARLKKRQRVAVAEAAEEIGLVNAIKASSRTKTIARAEVLGFLSKRCR